MSTRIPALIADRWMPRRRWREEEMPPAGLRRPPATDAARFTGPMTALRAPAAFVPGAEPPEDDPRGTGPYAAPSFTAHPDAAAMTSPQPALARPYTVHRESEPVHQSVLADLGTPSAVVTLPPPPPAPGCDVLPYTEPGWTLMYTEMRLRDGEWDDPLDDLDRIHGEVVAGTAGGFRHSRETIARGARLACAAIGQPDMATALLRRVAELNRAAREAAEGGAR